MKQKAHSYSLPLALALLTYASASQSADQNKFIEPPMVSIPAGEFFMGSDRGEANEQPVRKVKVPAFQIGKYEVTVAEFAKFIEDTNYEMPNNCYQHVFGGPRDELASWDTVVYKKSNFHPVVCLPQKAAVKYAEWLSEKTGKTYRLPTEAEWEYTLRAGTSSRHFFGNENAAHKSCEYANVSEWYAADKSKEIFEDAYVREVEECSDNEATLAMVGLYQPNPFGVYDLVGNVMEYLADCYVDDYTNAPTDGSAVTKADCDTHVVRGGSWHWKPWYSSMRGSIGTDFLGALEGFRLALDTNGKQLPAEKGNPDFVNNLAKAQAETKAKHKKIPAYPSRPKGLQVLEANGERVHLNWQKNGEPFVTGYKVYRQDPLTNSTQQISKVITTTEFVDNAPLAHNARYYVVALNGKTESTHSELADSGVIISHWLPTKIEGEAYSHADKPDVRYSTLEPENDKIINSLDDRMASYSIKVGHAGKYAIDARVFHSGDSQQLELWLGDKKLTHSVIEGERGWQTVKNIVVELPQGTHTLSVKGENPLFAINWLNTKAI